MKLFKIALGLIVLCGLFLAGTGCSDEDSVVTPPDFQVTIRVTDPQGFPVQGLDMALVPDTPFYQDGGKSPDFRPAVAIPFDVEFESNIRLTIEDIEGTEVRLLWEDPVPAGAHQVVWNGLDDAEQQMASGVYSVHLVVLDPATDEVILDDRAEMLMAIMDAMRMSVGTTNAEGRIVLRDKRLFPFLYDPADIPAVTENAELMGMIRLTALMRFLLVDLTNGGGMRFDREITGPTSLDLVWDVSQAIPHFPAGKTDFPAKVSREITRLGQPYPCPFN